MRGQILFFVVVLSALLLAACGGGGGTILPPPGGGGGGGGGSTYPQHYTTDLDGVWLGTTSDLRFSYFDPDGLLTASERAEFEADVRDILEGSEDEPSEIADGRSVVGTLPTLGYDTLQVTENRVSKLSATQYEQVFRLVGTVSSNGQTATLEIEGVASGFVNANRTVWTGSGSLTLDMSSAGQTVRITITYNFEDTKALDAA